MNTSSGFEPSVRVTVPSALHAHAVRYRVLVIDNEPAIGRVVARILGKQHDIVCCTDVDEACDSVRRGETFDVILCDLLMPKRSGPDFYRYVARFAPDLANRIAFITGAISLPSTREFLDGIANTTLEKPFTRAALVGLVQEVGRRSAAGGTPASRRWAC